MKEQAKPKPVLLLANAYSPENIIGAMRPARFARYLPEFGYQPYVITASDQSSLTPNVWHVPYRPGQLEKYFNMVFFPHDDRISWTWTAARAAKELLTRVRFEIVFSTSPPISGHLAAFRLKQLVGLKWIADFRDPIRGNFLHRPIWTKPLIFWLEKLIFRHADIVIANTDATAHFWKGLYPNYAQKIRVIYNGFDHQEPMLRPALIPPRAYRTLLHAGSLYTNIMHLTEFLNCYMRLIQNGNLRTDSICIKLIGDIENEPFFLNMSVIKDLISLGALQYVPHHIPVAEARQAMAEADGLLIMDRFGSNGILQVPAKVFEYIQIGRPILAFTNPGSPVASILSTSGVRHVCVYLNDSPELQDKKFLEFLNLSTDPVEPTEEYQRKFGAYEQTQLLAGVFDSVLQ